MGLEDANSGGVGFAATAEDGVATGGLDGRDDGGGWGDAGYVEELGGEVGGDGLNAWKGGERGGDGLDARVAVEGDGEGGLHGWISGKSLRARGETEEEGNEVTDLERFNA